MMRVVIETGCCVLVAASSRPPQPATQTEQGIRRELYLFYWLDTFPFPLGGVEPHRCIPWLSHVKLMLHLPFSCPRLAHTWSQRKPFFPPCLPLFALSIYPTPAYVTSFCRSSPFSLSTPTHLVYICFMSQEVQNVKRNGFLIYSSDSDFIKSDSSSRSPPLISSPLLSSPTWRAWRRSCIALCVMRWWSSPSSCLASTVCVCCAPPRCWYREVILLQTSLQSPTHRHPRPTLAPRVRPEDPHPGPPTALNGSSEQVDEGCVQIMCVFGSTDDLSMKPP